MTPAGRNVVDTRFPPPVSHSYCPIDSPSTMKRFLDAINPRVIVLAETEIWPNLIRQAESKGIKLILVNGRMSSNAASKYKWVSGAIRRLFEAYDHFFFKTSEDAARYEALGAPTDRSTIAGDMKFDAPLPPRSEGRRQEIRSRLGVDDEDWVFVAGSTRPGEEAIIADMHDALVSRNERMRIVIAPRHLDRLDEVSSLFAQRNIPIRRYHARPDSSRVVLIDQMGLLNDIYLASDLAFVGGTLVDIGGHNLLEPVWAGTPVVYGPYLDNVRDAAEYIELHQFGARVSGSGQLISMVEDCYHGRTQFDVKTDTDIKNSPTAMAGEYILKCLNDV
jgi:3-deoxy-D-manno-octulosonic-acid transferase